MQPLSTELWQPGLDFSLDRQNRCSYVTLHIVPEIHNWTLSLEIYWPQPKSAKMGLNLCCQVQGNWHLGLTGFSVKCKMLLIIWAHSIDWIYVKCHGCNCPIRRSHPTPHIFMINVTGSIRERASQQSCLFRLKLVSHHGDPLLIRLLWRVGGLWRRKADSSRLTFISELQKKVMGCSAEPKTSNTSQFTFTHIPVLQVESEDTGIVFAEASVIKDKTWENGEEKAVRTPFCYGLFLFFPYRCAKTTQE